MLDKTNKQAKGKRKVKQSNKVDFIMEGELLRLNCKTDSLHSLT